MVGIAELRALVKLKRVARHEHAQVVAVFRADIATCHQQRAQALDHAKPAGIVQLAVGDVLGREGGRRRQPEGHAGHARARTADQQALRAQQGLAFPVFALGETAPDAAAPLGDARILDLSLRPGGPNGDGLVQQQVQRLPRDQSAQQTARCSPALGAAAERPQRVREGQRARAHPRHLRQPPDASAAICPYSQGRMWVGKRSATLRAPASSSATAAQAAS